jgi:NAD(P)H-hydrate epimerase
MKQPPSVRFVTETRIEVPAISSAQMREVERIALEETGSNLHQMMENAGRNLALLGLELLGGAWRGRKVVVLAGAGGNGGGGICAARHLANHGADVRLYLAAPQRLGGVPSFQRKIFQSTSGRELEATELGQSEPGLIFDALIGYSLRAAPEGPVVDAIQWANASGAPIPALDVPSGVNADDGGTPGMFIRPRWTMTLALPKTGLLSERTGELFLAHIGIPDGTYRRIGLNHDSPFETSGWVRLRGKRISGHE